MSWVILLVFYKGKQENSEFPVIWDAAGVLAESERFLPMDQSSLFHSQSKAPGAACLEILSL